MIITIMNPLIKSNNLRVMKGEFLGVFKGEFEE